LNEIGRFTAHRPLLAKHSEVRIPERLVAGSPPPRYLRERAVFGHLAAHFFWMAFSRAFEAEQVN
jgi:hypothetical protein